MMDIYRKQFAKGGEHGKYSWDASLSYIRAISTGLIIACHILQYYGNALAWWLNVGVQVFFILSGYLFGKRKIDNGIDFLMVRCKKILVPYFLFVIVIGAVYAVICPEYFQAGRYAKMLLLADQLPGQTHLWFVAYIVFCYAITPYLYWTGERAKRRGPINYVIFVLAFMFMAQVISYVFGSFFNFGDVNCYVLGYFLSIGFDAYGDRFRKIVNNVIIFAAILANTTRIIVKYVLQYSFQGGFVHLFNAFEIYSHLLLGACVFLVLKRAFAHIRMTRWASWMDRYSYSIYLVHHTFILSPLKLMEVTGSRFFNIVIVLIVTFACAVLLQKVSDKLMNLHN